MTAVGARLERAIAARVARWQAGLPPALRLFHGDTEGDPRLAIERFVESPQSGTDRFVESPVTGSLTTREIVWVFERFRENAPAISPFERGEIVTTLDRAIPSTARSVYWLTKPARGLPPETPMLVSGESCLAIVSSELGLRYRIRSEGSRHPGLFLDHEPLRAWLIASGEARGAVLNTFSYTGSLSCAAALGGAASVLTLDLSKATIDWARENWALNADAFAARGATATSDFIYGDVFDWLPRFARQGRRFDTVILDPPSFSRAKTGNFSTEKDLGRLHAVAIALLNPGGLLISSINSETISPKDFEGSIARAAREAGRRFRIVRALAAEPTTFPNATHLKGAAVRLD